MQNLFKINLRKPEQLAKILHSRIGTVSIETPVGTYSFDPSSREIYISNELIIRLLDKRVLCQRECCDGCIKASILSLQEIRTLLVEMKKELITEVMSPLHLLLELQQESIRQFLTFHEKISLNKPSNTKEKLEDFHENVIYFSALNRLRLHLQNCIEQLSFIADSSYKARVNYGDITWDRQAYHIC